METPINFEADRVAALVIKISIKGNQFYGYMNK